ncbi:uncharacterized protein LOC124264180 isoform X1 [Haliotis rubra]|uniref:uncharacterized protein LOC124264180 isoform X1 n=1 Tax=Haliotis rubra TaxID=36100 RepID=UPI001EE523E9|nr:uncharacterized protein LOC124264180 isoform X1 [Haliotis rubra]
MEDRPTTTSATTTVQGGNNNDGNDRETCVMEDRPTTNQHGGMQLGNNNSITYKSCAITYITNITNNCKQCHQAEEHVVSADTPRDLMLRSPVNTTTSVRLVDCQGRELELGDVVMLAWLEDTPRNLIPSSSVHTTTREMVVDRTGRELELGDVVEAEGDIKVAIYAGGYDGVVAGDGMVIGLDTKTRKIVHEPINVVEPFTSRSPQDLNMSPKFSPMEIVERAKSIVGPRNPDGPVDIVFWCCTDMTLDEWVVCNEVHATNPEIVRLRSLNAAHSVPFPTN